MGNEKHRRSIRLPGADYSEPGGYFLTICAAGRKNIFGEIADGNVELSPLGTILRECWVAIPEHFAQAEIKEFVVMPNHLHGIVVLRVGARYIVPLDRTARQTESFQSPTKATMPTIVRAFKAAVTRKAGERLRMTGKDIWQRNYFERVLRNGKEYADASRYILENPLKWEWDKENAAGNALPSGAVGCKFE
jgi:putative transposase